jgi:hypothetical protein
MVERHVLRRLVDAPLEVVLDSSSGVLVDTRGRMTVLPGGTRRSGRKSPARYHPGMVPKARGAQVRWLETTSDAGQASAGRRSPLAR